MNNSKNYLVMETNFGRWHNIFFMRVAVDHRPFSGTEINWHAEIYILEIVLMLRKALQLHEVSLDDSMHLAFPRSLARPKRCRNQIFSWGSTVSSIIRHNITWRDRWSRLLLPKAQYNCHNREFFELSAFLFIGWLTYRSRTLLLGWVPRKGTFHFRITMSLFHQGANHLASPYRSSKH